MTSRTLMAALVVLLTSLHTTEPQARSARSACLDRQLAGAMAQGWRTRGVDTESIIPGDEASYEMSFHKGSRYLFLACTDDTDAKVTLKAVDAAGNPVVKDSEAGTSALLELKAARSGSHFVQVVITSSFEGKPTYYSLAMLYR